MKLSSGFVALVGIVAAGCSSSSPPSESACSGSAEQALTVCAKGARQRGVDVSYYQGSVSWGSVEKSGHAFAFTRVSDGAHFVDPKFATNWRGIKKAGMVRGVYQFFRPAQDPKKQARVLLAHLKAAGGFRAGDLPPVLDLETRDGVSSRVIRERARIWLDYVEAKLGLRPIVYTAAFMSSVIGSSLKSWPLWVANYGPKCPTMPSGWTRWKIWQDDDRGRVSGISGGVDTDFFDGTHAELVAFAAPADYVLPPYEESVDDPDVADVPEAPEPAAGDAVAVMGQGTRNPEPAPLDDDVPPDAPRGGGCP